VSYMGARVLRARGSIMSIFKKKKDFQCVTFLCTFDDVINFRELGEPKVGPFVFFQSEYYVKISNTENEV